MKNGDLSGTSVRLLTVKQVAELIQAKSSTVYSWAEQGLIPSFKVNGLLRFDETDVLAWLKTCKEPSQGGKMFPGRRP